MKQVFPHKNVENVLRLPLNFHWTFIALPAIFNCSILLNTFFLLLVDTTTLPTKRSPSWLQSSPLDVRTALVHEEFPPACQLVPRSQ